MRDSKGRFCRKMNRNDLTKLVGMFRVVESASTKDPGGQFLQVDEVYTDGYDYYIRRTTKSAYGYKSWLHKIFGIGKIIQEDASQLTIGSNVLTNKLIHIVLES